MADEEKAQPQPTDYAEDHTGDFERFSNTPDPAKSVFDRTDPNNVREISPNGNVVNYASPAVVQAATASAVPGAPAVAPFGSIAGRWDQPTAEQRWDQVGAGPSIQDRNDAYENRSGPLKGLRKLDLQKAELRRVADEAKQTHLENQDTVAATRLHADLAKKDYDLDQEHKINAGEADYFTWLKGQDTTGPNFDKAEAAHFAVNHYGLQGKSVQAFRAGLEPARKARAEIQAKGGASQFSSPVAQENYNRELNHSGDIGAAQAYGKNTETGEAAVRQLVGEGHLKPEDFQWAPPNADGSPSTAASTTNPHFIQSGPHFGAIDYDKLLFTGNQRKGEAATAKQAAATTKTQLADAAAQTKLAAEQEKLAVPYTKADLTDAYKYIAKHEDPPKDAEGAQRWKESMRIVTANRTRLSGKIIKPSIKPGTNAPGAHGPTSVTQGGHVYLRQPDGSYQ